MSIHHELKSFLASKFPQFIFRPDPRVREDVKFAAGSSAQKYSRNTDYWMAIREAAIRDLEQAEDSNELEKAIQALEKLVPHHGEADLLRVCKFVSKSDVIHDYNGDEDIVISFDNIIPDITHLLDKKETEALEQTFSIGIRPEEFQIEEDPLLPYYRQMDLDILDERVDDELENLPVPSESNDEPF